MDIIENKYTQRVKVNCREYTQDTIDWVNSLLKTLAIVDVHKITGVPGSTICNWVAKGLVDKPAVAKGHSGHGRKQSLSKIYHALKASEDGRFSVYETTHSYIRVVRAGLSTKNFKHYKDSLALILGSEFNVSRIYRDTFKIKYLGN